jgi:hypothetical protein
MKVSIHEQKMETTVQPYGTGYIQLITGRKIYHVKSSTPVSLDQILLADDGTTHVAKPGEAFSETQPACLLSTMRNGQMINGSPRDFSIEAVFNDPTGFTLPADLLALPAKVITASMEGTEEYIKDNSDPPKCVCTTSGEPFGKAPTRLSPGRIITITKWVTTSAKAAILACEHTLNDSAIEIAGVVCPQDTLLLQSAAFNSNVILGGVTIYQAVLTIGFLSTTWVDKALNVSFSALDLSTTPPKLFKIQIKDQMRNNWTPVTRPYPLNNDGTPFADPLADPIVLEFYPYPKSSWSAVPVA